MGEENHLKSFFWIMSWSLSFSVSLTILKTLSYEVSLLFLLFFRSFFGLVFTSPIFYKNKGKSFNSVRNKKLFFMRAALSLCVVSLTYFGYRYVPLATATSIGFSGPLFSITFSIFILGDTFSAKKWIFLFLGYLGVLLILQPGGIDFGIPILAFVLGNILVGIEINIIRILTRTEKVISLTFWTSALNTLVSFCFFLFLPKYYPPFSEFLKLLFIAFVGTFSGFCYLQSLAYARPCFVAPFEYTRILYAIPVGMIFFSETPNIWTYPGIFFIVLSLCLLNKKQRVLA